MNHTRFNCPHCERPLEVDISAVGLQVECPDCGEEIEVPPGNIQSEGTDDMPPDATQSKCRSTSLHNHGPKVPEGFPETDYNHRTLQEFQELLASASKKIIPLIEAASEEVRKELE